jgi:hypothetical protein
LLPKFLKEGEGFSNLTDEEFKHNVALAKSIVSVGCIPIGFIQ